MNYNFKNHKTKNLRQSEKKFYRRFFSMKNFKYMIYLPHLDTVTQRQTP